MRLGLVPSPRCKEWSPKSKLLGDGHWQMAFSERVRSIKEGPSRKSSWVYLGWPRSLPGCNRDHQDDIRFIRCSGTENPKIPSFATRILIEVSHPMAYTCPMRKIPTFDCKLHWQGVSDECSPCFRTLEHRAPKLKAVRKTLEEFNFDSETTGFLTDCGRKRVPTHDFHKGSSSCAMNFQLDPRSIQSTAIPRPCSSGALKYSMGNPSKSEGSNICFAAHASLKINCGSGVWKKKRRVKKEEANGWGVYRGFPTTKVLEMFGVWQYFFIWEILR